MSIYEYFEKRTRTFLTISGLMLVVIIGAFDYWTGVDISFSLFYLIPIALVTWFAGRESGILIAVAGAATWLLAELLWRIPDLTAAILFWNMLMRLGFFLIVVYLITRVKGLSGELQVLLKESAAEAGIKGLLLDNVADSVILHDLKGDILYVNEAACRMRGYKKEEMLKNNMHKLNTPENSDLFEKRIKELQKSGELTFESAHYHKDGTVTPIEVHAHIMDLDGRKAILRLGRDITERKREDEVLRQAKEFNENLVNTAQVIILTLDTEGRIVSYNPYMEKLSGYRLEEVKGKDWFTTFLPEGERGRIKELFNKAISGIQTKANVNPMLTKDRRELFTEWSDKTLKDRNGKVIGLISIGQDITERKRMEEALKYAEAQYRTITENSPDLIARFDRQFRHLYVNPMAAKAGHYLPKEYIGKTIREVGVPEKEAKKWEERIKAAFDTGQIIDVEDEFETPQRKQFFNTKFVPERTAEGAIASVQSIARDITERKIAYNDMQRSEARYRDLFNESRDAIMTLSPDKGFLSGNTATIKLFACKDEKDFTSHSPATLSPEFQPDGAPSMDKAQKMMNIALDKGSHFFEWTHRRANGTDFPATVLLSRLEHGGEANLQATVRDITEEERVKKELKSKIKELEDFFGATVGRENKMIALEREVDGLLKELGREPKYK